MSVNSSSDSSVHLPPYICLSRASVSVFTAVFISYIVLLLPLFILIFYVSYQRWKKRCSVAMPAMTSHSDIFTYNMVVQEMIGVLGCSIYCYGTYTNPKRLVVVGTEIFALISPGQTLFHLLTCVERYLAVVHPITYLGLRQTGGVRIRNISIGCVWLLCFGSVGLMRAGDLLYVIYNFFFLVLALIVVSFCSLSVLRVLIRPGPGDVGGNRERVDQSKQRAFYTIMVIMGALLLRFSSSIIVQVFLWSLVLPNSIDYCLVLWSLSWVSLPSSLVLPLLFLHRAGKLPGCKH